MISKFTKRLKLSALVLLFSSISVNTSVIAADVVFDDFVTGDTLTAASLNAKLNALKAEINLISSTPASGISTAHIVGSTGLPSDNFMKSGTWTSKRLGLGSYVISIPNLLVASTNGCVLAKTKSLPNPVVSIWNVGAVPDAAAFINGIGSSCKSLEWSFYVKTVINGSQVDSDFTMQFVNP